MRSPGLRVMDVATDWITHRHFRRLQRVDPEEWPRHVVALFALWGECWRLGSRDVTLDDAWHPMIPGDPERSLAALQSAGLLDQEGKVPAHSWDDWYGAYERRMEAARESGRRGGLLSAAKRKEEGSLDGPSRVAGGSLNPKPRPKAEAVAEETREKTPPVAPRTDALGWWDGWDNSALDPVILAWLDRFHHTGPTPGQKTALVRIGLLRPTDTAKWIREAPRGSPGKVVAYVIDRMKEVEQRVPRDDPGRRKPQDLPGEDTPEQRANRRRLRGMMGTTPGRSGVPERIGKKG